MLRGQLVGLRPRHDADVPILHAELYDDEPTWSRAHSQPWGPVAAESGRSPFAVGEPSDSTAQFSVVTLSDAQLVGHALLWGIDTHNRTAHIGLALIPDFHGRGYGQDIVRVLCRYGFVVRGLNRLQVDTLADNAAMIGAAQKCGFTLEGRLRASAWVAGEFVDEVILGLLARDWREEHPA
jgi:RimJ/RimL family protein N-acetyltransferase